MSKRDYSSLVGKKFGLWTVLAHVDSRFGHKIYLCRCLCGSERNVWRGHLKSGKSTNCGCLKSVKSGLRNRTHGMTKTQTHRAWSNMRLRCDNPKTIGYEHYGGRGISYAEHWSLFEGFFRDMGKCPDGYSLERKDVNGDYCPENCTWIPCAEQAHNKRSTVRLTYQGRTQSMMQWSRELGVNYSMLKSRISSGWSHEDALTIPSGGKR